MEHSQEKLGIFVLEKASLLWQLSENCIVKAGAVNTTILDIKVLTTVEERRDKPPMLILLMTFKF